MMTAVPEVIPVTTPEVELMSANSVLLLAQVPPATELLKSAVTPTQIAESPKIVGGKGFTVTTLSALPQDVE